MARRHKRRRGIVILVVLSLLVLFTLLVATYVIVAGQYRDAAINSSQQELLGVDPQKDLDKALYPLLRGNPIAGSSVRFHELLRDMYGEDGFRGTFVIANLADMNVLNSATANYPAAMIRSGGQVMELALGEQPVDDPTNGVQVTSTDRVTLNMSLILGQKPGYYNGCVLTITSGRAKGLSTRIIHGYLWFNSQNNSDPFNNRPILRIMTLAMDDGTSITPANLAGASFVVNGRPFSGKGFGYNSLVTSGPRLNRTVPYMDRGGAQHDLPIAMLPNYAAWDNSIVSLLLQGGSDEGYDAPDFQNMALAIMQRRPLGGGNYTTDRMPSFHRPALVRYWRNDQTPSSMGSTLWTEDVTGDFKRQFILRPIEPNFDGSNPDYYPPPIDFTATPPTIDWTIPSWYETGPWDVDNDGDGIRDSIWIDLGLPIQTAADGRKYRPLFAIMCRDLDGLLNVNAHGRIPWYVPATPANNGNATTPLIYRKGSGYGPPEIDLRWTGITGNLPGLLSARYGPDGRPGLPGFDQLARIRFFEEPTNYFTGLGGRSSYSSPSDLRAELAFGVDAFGVNASGQPIFEPLPDIPTIAARGDNPYETNLLGGATGDDPYTPAELERLLRRFDYDRHLLSQRLANYITNLQTRAVVPVTTDSFDVPVPSISAPPELVNFINSTINDNDPAIPASYNNDLAANNFMDLLIARLVAGGATNIQAQLLKMLSPDLAMGLKFDLNRPIGNARDGSPAGGLGSGMVDEPSLPPPMTPNTELLNDGLHAGDNAVGRPEFANVGMWHNNGFPEPDMDANGFVDDLDGDGEGNGQAPTPTDPEDQLLSRLLVRQRYARHLYVLMLTVMDHGTTGGVPNAPTAAVAQEVAQWAINVVDFRDADSIMTAFEYDVNPFNGWGVDGSLATNEGAQRQVVWGCERPELLLTEAMAFHARRTRDAATDTFGPNHDLASTTDLHYDQGHLPFASAFVEMYNPWAGTDSNTTPPWELYGYIDANGNGQFDTGETRGVQLNRTTPGGNPVWRLLFVNQSDVGLAAITTNALNPDSGSAVNADRAVYFIDAPANLPPAGAAHGRRQYYTSLRVAPIPPGRHAVVGGGVPIAGEWVSPVGDDANGLLPNNLPPNDTSYQHIVLAPATDQVRVYPGVIDPNTGQPAATEIAQAVAIVPNLWRNEAGGTDYTTRVQTAFSVSEPRAGYPITAGVVEFNATNRANLADRPVPFSYSGFYEDPAALGTPLPYDIPLDNNQGNGQFATLVGGTDGTTPSFCRVYLQRLANPLLPWNPLPGQPGYDPTRQVNPYRTIDSTPMDLTVFNGLELYPSGAPDAPNEIGVDFTCLQRGDSDPATSLLRLWPQERARTAAGTQTSNANLAMYFNFSLASHSLGSRNDPHTPLPNGTFPWFAWNNRPFVSAYELMHVPRLSSWHLLRTYRDPADPMADPVDGYVRNFRLPSDNPAGFDSYNSQTPEYRHLLNFFHSTGVGTPPHNLRPPHYYRIFDYVHVPSRFVGTDTVLNPEYFGNTTNFPQPNPISLGFLPPFNRISKYRVPGLVNINTIPDPAVWGAILGPHVLHDLSSGAETPVYLGPNYATMFASREGAAASDSTIPTWFPQPFRPMGSGDMVPINSLRTSGIANTLLRPDSTGTPLAEVANMADPVRHTRNSPFRYELLHRLGNMVTTRSNVYAISITVGYFEMEPNNVGGQVVYDRHHPQGLRVGQEIGIDTGEIQRHRAFYMIDRTIPVAFDPGENHNVDKCVLLRRFIE